METISKKKWMSIYNSIMEMLSGYFEMVAGYDALVSFRKEKE